MQQTGTGIGEATGNAVRMEMISEVEVALYIVSMEHLRIIAKLCLVFTTVFCSIILEYIVHILDSTDRLKSP